jgi:hypothetical protein
MDFAAAFDRDDQNEDQFILNIASQPNELIVQAVSVF